MENKHIKPVKPLRCPLTPYQLFSPVSTVFLDNLTYEEQLLGLYKLYNEFIIKYNELIELVSTFQEQIDENANQIRIIQNSLAELSKQMSKTVEALLKKIENGDAATIKSATDYTNQQFEIAIDYIDQQIKKIEVFRCGYLYGAISAGEYDGLEITAADYEVYEMSAYEYDTRAKYILLGEDGSIYLDFRDTFTASSLENVFDLRAPPIKLGKRYLFEISLGNFSLDGNEPAHLEIVGRNTLGETLPITVPNGGLSAICGIFQEIPTSVRMMSGSNQITGYNAYIKIKPLGEK